MANQWVRMRHINTGVVTDVHPKVVNSYGRRGWVDESKPKPGSSRKLPPTSASEGATTAEAVDGYNISVDNADNATDKEPA